MKWVSDRSEAFLTDAHGRDHVTHAEMAFDADSKVTGLRVKTIANLGAYMSTFSSSVPTYLYGTLLSGQYDIPAIYCEVDAVYTNTVPVDAYRGAGRPEATFVVERLIEVGARELGVDPADLRQKNFIKTFPHQTPVIMTYDAGDYQRLAQEGAGDRRLRGFGKRKRESARQASCAASASRPTSKPAGSHRARRSARLAAVSACGNRPRCGSIRPARSRSSPAATSTARATRPRSPRSSPNGSASRSTMSASCMATPTRCSSAWAPMARAPARSAFRAIVKALDKVEVKAKKIAAHLLEAAEGDIVFKDGKFTVAGTDKSAAWGDVALAAYTAHNLSAGMEPGLKEGAFYDPDQLHLPGRQPHLRSRGRSATGEARSCSSPRSTISAPSSIR